MADLIAEATRWRVLLPVGALKGIAEDDAYRLGAEHGVRPDRAWVRLYADGTEVLGPWSPAPSIGSPADRAQDDLTDRLAAALADALSYIECVPAETYDRWRALLTVHADRAQVPAQPAPGSRRRAS